MGKTTGKIEEMNRAVHRFLGALGTNRLDKWSDKFEGLGGMDISILRSIALQPDIILKEIREKLDVPQSTLTSIIDRLENRGLLKRVISKRDRRSFGLELTKKGWDVQEEHNRIDLVGAKWVLEVLGERDGKQFIKMISKISEKFEEEYMKLQEGGNHGQGR